MSKRVAAALFGSLAITALTAFWLFSANTSSNAVDRPSRAARAAFEEKTGVRVIRVALSGGGGLVDFRYQVVDAEKAETVHLNAPSLIDEKTGEVIDTPFMGHSVSHRSEPKAGYTYPLLLVNEQGLVERGDAVSVIVGDSRLEHIAVR